MHIVTQTEVIGSRLGHIQAVELIGRAGFDAYDFSMFDAGEGNPLFGDGWRAYLDRVMDTAKLYGMRCLQAHAPFPSAKEDLPENKVYNERTFDYLVRSIEGAGYLGAAAVVIHPVTYLYDPEHKEALWEANREFYRSLAPYAKAAGVKIALENMWVTERETHRIIPSSCGTAASFCRYLDELKDDCFTACLDIGHTVISGCDPVEIIHALGHDRLTALHVHDNDGKHDSHLFPFMGVMPWEAICQALGEIDYSGPLTFEADNTFLPYPDDLLLEPLMLLKKTGQYLADRIDASRPRG